MKNIAAIVLAAGKGTRMKSAIPKVMHEILGIPILAYVLENLRSLELSPIVVVTGFGKDSVCELCRKFGTLTAHQEEQMGTAHAVGCARDALSGHQGHVLIICGDTPLIRSSTIEKFLGLHLRTGGDISVLSVLVSDPRGYGRILREPPGEGRFVGIVEEKDADDIVQMIKEVNTGVYAVKSQVLFGLIDKVDSQNSQREYYLTDIVKIGRIQGLCVNAFCVAQEMEALGVNSRKDLSLAEEVMLERIQEYWMEQGVTFQLRRTCYIDKTVRLSRDVVVGAHSVLAQGTTIGEGVRIGPYVHLENVHVGDGCEVPARTVLHNCSIGTPGKIEFTE
ncbi:MAG: NTP transferase domain-containing protein [Deltaproteobacteria bacterium]